MNIYKTSLEFGFFFYVFSVWIILFLFREILDYAQLFA